MIRVEITLFDTYFRGSIGLVMLGGQGEATFTDSEDQFIDVKKRFLYVAYDTEFHTYYTTIKVTYYTVIYTHN